MEKHTKKEAAVTAASPLLRNGKETARAWLYWSWCNNFYQMVQHTINAKGKILGRLAGEIAVLLRGKNDPRFDPGKFVPHEVFVYNADYVRVSGKKPDQKMYYAHSGYIGNLKQETLAEVLRRDSRLLVRRAIYGMLPKNKLRDRFMKHLRIMKGDEKT